MMFHGNQFYPSVRTILRIASNGCNMGCLESVEWNGGMECWNGTLEWNTRIDTGIAIYYPAYV